MEMVPYPSLYKHLNKDLVACVYAEMIMHIMLPEDVLGCIRDYIYVPPILPTTSPAARSCGSPTNVCCGRSDVEFTSEEEEEVDDDYSYGLGYQSDDY